MNGVTYLLALREALAAHNLPDPAGIILNGGMFDDIRQFASKYVDYPAGVDRCEFNGFWIVEEE